ncbi:MAG: dockerin type I repeat-containing protein [candidate division Zixibacteria bacterium]|nr:dockerin type I repeat-containing protein [candidate division Zixibacteria bacterium]
MKTIFLTGLVATVLLLQAVAGDDYHQAGSAGSGRAASTASQLEQIIGQTAVGTAGELTSGFLALRRHPTFVAGDADGDGMVNISDVIYLIQYIFNAGPAPEPLVSGDADCDGLVNIADVLFLIVYIFDGGPAPPPCY